MLFDSNIKPVREALRQKSSSGGGGCGEEEDSRVPFFPFVPWESKHSKVAVGIVLEVESFHSSSRRYTSTVRGSGMGRLHRIMAFPRLLEEFHTFCQKALCSESLVFLMEVLEFRELFETNPDEDGHFFRFVSIASKFIKRDAPCEINIGSKSKAGILSFMDRDRFNGLDMVRYGIVRRACSTARKVDEFFPLTRFLSLNNSGTLITRSTFRLRSLPSGPKERHFRPRRKRIGPDACG